MVENALCYGYVGALVFDDNERVAVVVVDDRVASFCKSVVVDSYFVGYARHRSFESVGYVYDCVLPNPFFRCENKPFASYRVKYL